MLWIQLRNLKVNFIPTIFKKICSYTRYLFLDNVENGLNVVSKDMVCSMFIKTDNVN